MFIARRRTKTRALRQECHVYSPQRTKTRALHQECHVYSPQRTKTRALRQECHVYPLIVELEDVFLFKIYFELP